MKYPLELLKEELSHEAVGLWSYEKWLEVIDRAYELGQKNSVEDPTN